MTLAVQIEGRDDAPAVVLLHAIATSSKLWAPQVAPLAADFRVIRVDLPGHGASPLLPGCADYESYADAVVSALADRGIDKFVLVGLSFGAMVAMQIAVRNPDTVAGLVLACCAAYTPPPVAAMWRDRVDGVKQGGLAGQAPGTLGRWFTPSFAEASPQTVEWVRGMIVETPDEGFVAAATMISTLDHRELLPRITARTVVVAGEHDQAAQPAGLAAIADAIPNASLITLNAAHLANVEAPVAFVEAIAAFAKGL